MPPIPAVSDLQCIWGGHQITGYIDCLCVLWWLFVLGNASFSFTLNHKFALLVSILLPSCETGYHGICVLFGCYSQVTSVKLCQWETLQE